MLQKIYRTAPEGEKRYSPAECIGVETRVVSGEPDSKHISTSYVERQNLNLRMGMHRFTRLTNAFSKKLANHAHMVALYTVFYNLCRIHQTLKVTPAMETGITDRLWTIADLVAEVDRWEAQQLRKKPDRKQDARAIVSTCQEATETLPEFGACRAVRESYPKSAEKHSHPKKENDEHVEDTRVDRSPRAGGMWRRRRRFCRRRRLRRNGDHGPGR